MPSPSLMQRLGTFGIAAAVYFCWLQPVIAQPKTDDQSNFSQTGATDGQKHKGVLRLNRAAAEWKIRQLNERLGLHPEDRQCRLDMASTMETLAEYCEAKYDYLYASRYYEGAAHVLAYPKDKECKKRAQEDLKQAARCKDARVKYLSNLGIKGVVFVSFNWHKFKGLQPQLANDYSQKIGLQIRKNWSVAKRISNLDLGEFAGPKIIVAFNVHKDGKISDIKLTKSCGRPPLDAIALSSVKSVEKVPPLLPPMGDVLAVEAQFAK